MTEIKGITRQALKNLLVSFLTFALVIIFFAFLSAPTYSKMSRIGMVYTLYFNLYVMLTYVISFTTCYLRVYIAFGSTRRRLFISKNIVALGLICIVNIVDMIVYVIFDKMELTRIIGSIIICILVLAAGEILSLILFSISFQSYVLIEYFTNTFISRIFTIPFLFLIIYVIYRKKFLQTLYLVIISYSMFAILGAFLIVPFRFLLTDISNNSTMIFGNIASLIITLAATHFLDFSPVYQFILKRDFWFNAIILNIFNDLFVVITVSKVDLKLTIAYYPLIYFYVVIAVLFNIALINSKHKIIVQEQIIRQKNEY